MKRAFVISDFCTVKPTLPLKSINLKLGLSLPDFIEIELKRGLSNGLFK